MIDTEGRVERFMRKYGMLDTDGVPTKKSESKEK
jgi:hypothetical protein